jgi:hypothetical protein
MSLVRGYRAGLWALEGSWRGIEALLRKGRSYMGAEDQEDTADGGISWRLQRKGVPVCTQKQKLSVARGRDQMSRFRSLTFRIHTIKSLRFSRTFLKAILDSFFQ